MEHKPNDYTMLCDHTLILIEFDKVLNVTNEDYFNYHYQQPNIKTITSADDFSKYKKCLTIDNVYMNFVYLNIINDNKYLLKNFICLLIELLVIEETFDNTINSNKNYSFEWSMYCHIRLSNEMSVINDKRINKNLAFHESNPLCFE